MDNIFRQAGSQTLLATLLVAIAFIKLAHTFLKQPRRTDLRGPPSNSLFFGRFSDVALGATDSGNNYEIWANEYGRVYTVPLVIGISGIVLCDLKAIAHVHARDTRTYILPPVLARFQDAVVGRNISNSEGVEHKRLRRAMTPAFSTAVLRPMVHVFYDSAYKIKTHWDALFESDIEATIDVQKWVNRLTLDVIGIAGFGHDFKSLDGQPSPIIEMFDEFGSAGQDLVSHLALFAAAIHPSFLKIQTNRMKLFTKLSDTVSEVARQLVENEQRGRQASRSADDARDATIIGSLAEGMSSDATGRFSREGLAALNSVLLAAYETTAISITWALIELARHPEIQQRLREELQHFLHGDPSWDQLKSSLPLLDAVVHETLRLYPALQMSFRTAAEDDTIPLGHSIRTSAGELVDSVTVPKGTVMMLPHVFFNRSEEYWGPDAKEFIPDRWLCELEYPAKEIRGHRHLFTFADGQKMCLGRDFAITEFKAALSVLIRNFTFELPDGVETKLDYHLGILTRPKVAGEVGAAVPMRVRQVTK